MPLLTPNVPKGLIDLMKGLTKEILRDKPENIYEYAAVHFEKQLCERDGSLHKDYELFTGFKVSFEGQQQFIVPASLGFKCQRLQRGSGTRRSKPDILSSFKVMESIHEEDAPAENLYSDEKYQKAIYVIQRFYRRYISKKRMRTRADKQSLTETTAAIIIQRTMRKLFANKFSSRRGGDSVRRDEVPQEDVDTVSEAASYTSSSTIQLLAESQEGRENRSTTGREEIADDNGVGEGDGSTTVADVPPMEGEQKAPTPTPEGSVDGKSMAHENDKIDLVSYDELSINPPTPRVSDDTSTAPIGILSAKIGSNDQQNSLQTNTVEVAKNSSSDPTQVQTAQDVAPVESNPPQSLGSTPEPQNVAPPTRQSSEKAFAVRLQSNAFADNNAGYNVQSVTTSRKLMSDTGESLKMYSVFYQDGDDPDFSDSLNESTMERDSLETVDLDADSLESNENAAHVGAIVKRETVTAEEARRDVDAGGEEEYEEQQNAQESELERVPSYLYGIHPTRTLVPERKNIKHRAAAEAENFPNVDEKSEEDSMESKESTSEESSATQIENVLEARGEELCVKDGAEEEFGEKSDGVNHDLDGKLEAINSNNNKHEAVEMDSHLNADESKAIESRLNEEMICTAEIGGSTQESQISPKDSFVEEIQASTKDPSSNNELLEDEPDKQVNGETIKLESVKESEGKKTTKSETDEINREHIELSTSGTPSTSDHLSLGYFEALYNIKESISSPTARQDSEVESQLKDVRSLCNLYPGLEMKDIISEFHTKHIQPEARRKNSVYDDNNNVEDFEAVSSEDPLVDEGAGAFEESNKTELSVVESKIGVQTSEGLVETQRVGGKKEDCSKNEMVKVLQSSASEIEGSGLDQLKDNTPHEDTDEKAEDESKEGKESSEVTELKSDEISKAIYPDESNDVPTTGTIELDLEKPTKDSVNQEQLETSEEKSVFDLKDNVSDDLPNKAQSDTGGFQPEYATNYLDYNKVNPIDGTHSLLSSTVSSDGADDTGDHGTEKTDVNSQETNDSSGEKEDYEAMDDKHEQPCSKSIDDVCQGMDKDRESIKDDSPEKKIVEVAEEKEADLNDALQKFERRDKVEGDDPDVVKEFKSLTETRVPNSENTVYKDDDKETLSGDLGRPVDFEKIESTRDSIENEIQDSSAQPNNQLEGETKNVDFQNVEENTTDKFIESSEIISNESPKIYSLVVEEEIQNLEALTITNKIEDVGSIGKLEVDSFLESSEVPIDGSTKTESSKQKEEHLEDCENTSEIDKRDVGSIDKIEVNSLIESSEVTIDEPKKPDRQEQNKENKNLEKCENTCQIEESGFGSIDILETDSIMESSKSSALKTDGLKEDANMNAPDEYLKLEKIDEGKSGELEDSFTDDALSEERSIKDGTLKAIDKREVIQESECNDTNIPPIKSSATENFQKTNEHTTIELKNTNKREPKLDEVEAQIIEMENDSYIPETKLREQIISLQQPEELTSQSNENVEEAENVSSDQVVEEIVKVSTKYAEIDASKKPEHNIVENADKIKDLQKKEDESEESGAGAYVTIENLNENEKDAEEQQLKVSITVPNKATCSAGEEEKSENTDSYDKTKETELDEINESSDVQKIAKIESTGNSKDESIADLEGIPGEECLQKVIERSNSHILEQETRLDPKVKDLHDAESVENNKSLKENKSSEAFDSIDHDSNCNTISNELESANKRLNEDENKFKLNEIFVQSEDETQKTLSKSENADQFSPETDNWKDADLTNLEMSLYDGEKFDIIKESIKETFPSDHGNDFTVSSESNGNNHEPKGTSQMEMRNVASPQLTDNSPTRGDAEAMKSENPITFKEQTELEENPTKQLTDLGAQGSKAETGLKDVLRSFKTDEESKGIQETLSAHDSQRSIEEADLDGTHSCNFKKTDGEKGNEEIVDKTQESNLKNLNNVTSPCEQDTEKSSICDAVIESGLKNDNDQTKVQSDEKRLLSDDAKEEKIDETGLKGVLRSYKTDTQAYDLEKSDDDENLKISLKEEESQESIDEIKIKNSSDEDKEIQEDAENISAAAKKSKDKNDNGLKDVLKNFKDEANETQESPDETGLKVVLENYKVNGNRHDGVLHQESELQKGSEGNYDTAEESIEETGLTDVLKSFKDTSRTSDLETTDIQNDADLLTASKDAENTVDETGLTTVLKHFKDDTSASKQKEIHMDSQATLTDEEIRKDVVKTGLTDVQMYFKEVSPAIQNEVLKYIEDHNEIKPDEKCSSHETDDPSVKLKLFKESSSLKLEQEKKTVDENNRSHLNETGSSKINENIDENAVESKQSEETLLGLRFSSVEENFKDLGGVVENDGALSNDLWSSSRRVQDEDSIQKETLEREEIIKFKSDVRQGSKTIIESSKAAETSKIVETDIENELRKDGVEGQSSKTTDQTEVQIEKREIQYTGDNDEINNENGVKRNKRSITNDNFSDVLKNESRKKVEDEISNDLVEQTKQYPGSDEEDDISVTDAPFVKIVVSRVEGSPSEVRDFELVGENQGKPEPEERNFIEDLNNSMHTLDEERVATSTDEMDDKINTKMETEQPCFTDKLKNDAKSNESDEKESVLEDDKNEVGAKLEESNLGETLSTDPHNDDKTSERNEIQNEESLSIEEINDRNLVDVLPTPSKENELGVKATLIDDNERKQEEGDLKLTIVQEEIHENQEQGAKVEIVESTLVKGENVDAAKNAIEVETSQLNEKGDQNVKFDQKETDVGKDAIIAYSLKDGNVKDIVLEMEKTVSIADLKSKQTDNESVELMSPKIETLEVNLQPHKGVTESKDEHDTDMDSNSNVNSEHLKQTLLKEETGFTSNDTRLDSRKQEVNDQNVLEHAIVEVENLSKKSEHPDKVEDMVKIRTIPHIAVTGEKDDEEINDDDIIAREDILREEVLAESGEVINEFQSIDKTITNASEDEKLFSPTMQDQTANVSESGNIQEERVKDISKDSENSIANDDEKSYQEKIDCKILNKVEAESSENNITLRTIRYDVSEKDNKDQQTQRTSENDEKLEDIGETEVRNHNIKVINNGLEEGTSNNSLQCQKENEKVGEVKLQDIKVFKENNQDVNEEGLIAKSINSELFSEKILEGDDESQSKKDTDAKLHLQDVIANNQSEVAPEEEGSNKLKDERELLSNLPSENKQNLIETEFPGNTQIMKDNELTSAGASKTPQSPESNHLQLTKYQAKFVNQTDLTISSPTRSTEVTEVDGNTADTSADFSSIGKDLEFFEDTIHYLKSATAHLGTGIEDIVDKSSEKKSSESALKTEDMLNKAAIIIQSVVRGYRVRREFKKKLSSERQQSSVMKYAAEGSSSIPVAIIHPTKHSTETQTVPDGVRKAIESSCHETASISGKSETPRSEIPRLKRERPLERRTKTEESAASRTEAKVTPVKARSEEEKLKAKPRLTREKPIERNPKQLKGGNLDETKQNSEDSKENILRTPSNPEKVKRPNHRIVSSSKIPERHRLVKSKRDQFAKKGKSLSTNAQTQEPLVFDLEAIKKDLLSKKPVSHSGKKTRTVTKRDPLKEKVSLTTVDASLADQSKKSHHSNVKKEKEKLKKDKLNGKSDSVLSDLKEVPSPRISISEEKTNNEVQEVVCEKQEVKASDSFGINQDTMTLESETELGNQETEVLKEDYFKEIDKTNAVNTDLIDEKPCDQMKEGDTSIKDNQESVNEPIDVKTASLKEAENACQTDSHNEILNGHADENKSLKENSQESTNEQIENPQNDISNKMAAKFSQGSESDISNKMVAKLSRGSESDISNQMPSEFGSKSANSIKEPIIKNLDNLDAKDVEAMIQDSSVNSVVGRQEDITENKIVPEGSSESLNFLKKSIIEDSSNDLQPSVKSQDLNQTEFTESKIENKNISDLENQFPRKEVLEETCKNEELELDTNSESKNVRTEVSNETDETASYAKTDQPGEDEVKTVKLPSDENDVFENQSDINSESNEYSSGKGLESELQKDSIAEVEFDVSRTRINENMVQDSITDTTRQSDKNWITTENETNEIEKKEEPLDKTIQNACQTDSHNEILNGHADENKSLKENSQESTNEQIENPQNDISNKMAAKFSQGSESDISNKMVAKLSRGSESDISNQMPSEFGSKSANSIKEPIIKNLDNLDAKDVEAMIQDSSVNSVVGRQEDITENKIVPEGSSESLNFLKKSIIEDSSNDLQPSVKSQDLNQTEFTESKIENKNISDLENQFPRKEVLEETCKNEELELDTNSESKNVRTEVSNETDETASYAKTDQPGEDEVKTVKLPSDENDVFENQSDINSESNEYSSGKGLESELQKDSIAEVEFDVSRTRINENMVQDSITDTTRQSDKNWITTENETNEIEKKEEPLDKTIQNACQTDSHNEILNGHADENKSLKENSQESTNEQIENPQNDISNKMAAKFSQGSESDISNKMVAKLSRGSESDISNQMPSEFGSKSANSIKEPIIKNLDNLDAKDVEAMIQDSSVNSVVGRQEDITENKIVPEGSSESLNFLKKSIIEDSSNDLQPSVKSQDLNQTEFTESKIENKNISDLENQFPRKEVLEETCKNEELELDTNSESKNVRTEVSNETDETASYAKTDQPGEDEVKTVKLPSDENDVFENQSDINSESNEYSSGKGLESELQKDSIAEVEFDVSRTRINENMVQDSITDTTRQSDKNWITTENETNEIEKKEEPLDKTIQNACQTDSHNEILNGHADENKSLKENSQESTNEQIENPQNDISNKMAAKFSQGSESDISNKMVAKLSRGSESDISNQMPSEFGSKSANSIKEPIIKNLDNLDAKDVEAMIQDSSVNSVVGRQEDITENKIVPEGSSESLNFLKKSIIEDSSNDLQPSVKSQDLNQTEFTESKIENKNISDLENQFPRKEVLEETCKSEELELDTNSESKNVRTEVSNETDETASYAKTDQPGEDEVKTVKLPSDENDVFENQSDINSESNEYSSGKGLESELQKDSIAEVEFDVSRTRINENMVQDSITDTTRQSDKNWITTENETNEIEKKEEPLDKTIQADLNHPAIIIQKTFRGYNTRKTLNNRNVKGNEDQVESIEPQDAQQIDPPVSSNSSLDASATIIQKHFRGYRTRKDLNTSKQIAEADDYSRLQSTPASKSPESQKFDDSAVIIQKTFRGYRTRKELNESTRNKAAVVIQKSYKGYKTRKDLEGIQEQEVGSHDKVHDLPAEDLIPEMNTGMEDPQEAAATMIQKTYKGYRTRKTMLGNGVKSDATIEAEENNNEQVFQETAAPHASSIQPKSTSAHALLESAAEALQKVYQDYNDRKESPVKSYSHGAKREHVSKEVVENSDESSIFIGPDTSFDLSDLESVETKSEQISDTSTFVATDDKPEDVISKTPTLGLINSPEHLELDSTNQPQCSTLSIESEIRRKRSIIEPSAPALEDILKSDELSSADRKLQWYVGDDPIIPTDSINLPSTSLQTPLDTSSSSRFENSCSTDARLEISDKQPTPSIKSTVVSTSSLLFPNDSEMHNTDTFKQFTKPSRAVSAEEEKTRAREDEEKENKIEENAEERRLEEDTARAGNGCCHKGEIECSKVLSADPFSVVIKVEDLGELPVGDVHEIEAEVCKSCAGGMHEAGLAIASPRRKSIEEISRAIDEDATNVGNDTKDDTASDSVDKNVDEIKQFVLMEEANKANITEQCININDNNSNKSHNDSDLADVNEFNKINTQNDTTDSQVSGIQSEGGDHEQKAEDDVGEGHGSETDQRECPAITLILPSSDDDVSDKYDALFEKCEKGENDKCKDGSPSVEAEDQNDKKGEDQNELLGLSEAESKEVSDGKILPDDDVKQAECSNETKDLGNFNQKSEEAEPNLKTDIVGENLKKIQSTAEGPEIVSSEITEDDHREEKLEEDAIVPVKQTQVTTFAIEANTDCIQNSNESHSSGSEALELSLNRTAQSTEPNIAEDHTKSALEAAAKDVLVEVQESGTNTDGIKKENSTEGQLLDHDKEPLNVEGNEAGTNEVKEQKSDIRNFELPALAADDALEADGAPEANDVSAANDGAGAGDRPLADDATLADKASSVDETAVNNAPKANDVQLAENTLSANIVPGENIAEAPNVGQAEDDALAEDGAPPTDDTTKANDGSEAMDVKALDDSHSKAITLADKTSDAAGDLNDIENLHSSNAADKSIEALSKEEKDVDPTEENAPQDKIQASSEQTDIKLELNEVHSTSEKDYKHVEVPSESVASEENPPPNVISKDVPEHKDNSNNRETSNGETTENPEIEAKLDQLIDAAPPLIEKDSVCVEQENLPIENSSQEVVEEPCVKKIISSTPLSNASEQDDSEIESTTTKADSTTTSAAYDEASETEALDNTPSLHDTLEKATEALRESEAVVARMHLRRDSEQKASIEHVETLPLFSDIASEPVKPMQELQKPSSPEADDDIIVQNLQKGDTTRESSAQSESVVFGNSSSQLSESDDVFNENFDIRTMHRMNTVAVDHGTYRAPHMLFKSVTIDDTVKYIDPEKSTEESGDSFCLDDALTADVRKKMMAYSVSEADSDYYEPGERSAHQRDDFNISTALDKFTSSDTDTTIVSAATKIQAGARGFLTRRRLRRASMGTRASLTDGTKASFGNDAIGESLDRLVEEEVNKRMPKTHYQRQVGVNSLPSALGNSEETENAHSAPPTQDELSALTATTKLLASSSPNTQHDDPRYGHGLLTSSDYDVNADIGSSIDESSQALSSNLEATLAARRLTLQRGDAMRNDSTPDDDNGNSGSGKQVEQAKITTANTGAILIHQSTLLESTSTVTTTNTNTERKGYSDAATATRMEKIKWFAMRQNSMPVQIDSEVFRVLPKHMRKRIKSAEGQQKRRIRLPRD